MNFFHFLCNRPHESLYTPSISRNHISLVTDSFTLRLDYDTMECAIVVGLDGIAASIVAGITGPLVTVFTTL